MVISLQLVVVGEATGSPHHKIRREKCLVLVVRDTIQNAHRQNFQCVGRCLMTQFSCPESGSHYFCSRNFIGAQCGQHEKKSFLRHVNFGVAQFG